MGVTCEELKAAGDGAQEYVGKPRFSDAPGIGFLPPSHRYSESYGVFRTTLTPLVFLPHSPTRPSRHTRFVILEYFYYSSSPRVTVGLDYATYPASLPYPISLFVILPIQLILSSPSLPFPSRHASPQAPEL